MKITRTAIALAGALVIGAAVPASAQDSPREISFMEVIHSLFYSPLYVAHGQGWFEEEGLTFDLTVSQGSDKATAALLSGSVDIALIGPETSVYVANGQSPEKLRIFAGLTATDGSYLVGREADADFEWSDLKGKSILSWRRGSSPDIYLRKALTNAGLDPDEDVEIIANVAIPARVGAFISGTADFGTFFEPDVSTIESQGAGHALANVGEAVGKIDYTSFVTSVSFMNENPEIVQGFTNAIARAQDWIYGAPAEDVAEVLAPYFQGLDKETLVSSVERHRSAGIWKTGPMVTPEAIEGLQTLLIEADILTEDDRVAYEDVVETRFAESAKE